LTVSTRPDKADAEEKTIDNIAAGIGSLGFFAAQVAVAT
jgi:hypothetical protein